MRHDLTSLKIFVSVAECANLTRAAEREHLAVSAVSKRIAELEDQIGTPLLVRQARGVGLTPAGQSLLHHARRLLRVMHEMDDELREYARGLKGHVRLHAVASALTQFLPPEIEAFLALFPDVQLSVEERTGKAIVRAVGEGVADVGIVADATPLQGLTAWPYHRDRLMLGVPAGHPLARRKTVRFEEALDHVFVGPHADSSLSMLMTAAAQRCGKPLRQRVQASSFDAMCRLVEARLGLTLLPSGVITRLSAGGLVKPVVLAEDWAVRQLLIVVRDPAELGPVSRTLIEHLQHAAAPDDAAAASVLRTRTLG